MRGWRFCARELFVSVLTVLAIGLAVTLIIDSIERSRLLSSLGPFQFVGYMLSRLVPLTREVFPLLVCAGVAFGIGRMRSRGDLSGLMATGVSPSTLLYGALVVGVSASLAAAVLDSLTPIANRHAELVVAEAADTIVSDVGNEASWIPVTGGALRVEAYSSGELLGLEHVSFEDGLTRVLADSAVWSGGEWLLYGGMSYGIRGNMELSEPAGSVDMPPPEALSVILQGARLSYQSASTLAALGTEKSSAWWHYRVSRIFLVTVLALWGFVFAAAFPFAPVSSASLATISSAVILSVEMVLVQVGALYFWMWLCLALAVLVTLFVFRRRGVALL